MLNIWPVFAGDLPIYGKRELPSGQSLLSACLAGRPLLHTVLSLMAKRRGKPSSGEKSKRQRTAAERRLVSATLPWRSPPASPSFNNNDAAPSLQPGVMAVGAERALPAVSRRASRIASGSEQDQLNENDNQPQRLIFAYVRIVVVGDLDLKDQEVRSGAEHCLG
jgi:hypothetical protein